MATKKYVSLSKLSNFLDNLKNTFSSLVHTHKISDITDFSVDSELSSTSINPVQNKVLDAEFEAISEALSVYDASLDDKASVVHTHKIADVNNLQSTIDTVNDTLAQKSQVQMVTLGETESFIENLSTLKIHKLTQEQYEQKVASGNIDENALYLTPDSNIYATVEQLNDKADISHNHDDIYYTEIEIDTFLSGINTSISNITNGNTTVAEAISATKATQDANGNIISSTYETKTDATTKLNEAKEYVDSAVTTVKNDLLNGAGTAYDTLKELGDLIDENTDAIGALETIAFGKADVSHTHNDIYYTETEINEKISTINTSISSLETELKSYVDTGNTSVVETSKVYTDNAVAQKTQVQIITLEDND